MKRSEWRQIGGDMNPGKHGGTIARFDGDAVEIREIQPVREFVGDEEAKEVGFPFWTKEGYYDEGDLDPSKKDVQQAMKSYGFDIEDLPKDKESRLLVLAECMLSYGVGADEGPAGWSEDVVPDRVHWASGEVAGSEYLEDEDEDFKLEIGGVIVIRETYEIITEESSKDGEASESGFIDEEGTEYSLDEAVELLEGTEPSSSQFHPGIWYTQYEYETDYHKGSVESRSYHLAEDTPKDIQKRLYQRVTGKKK